jgi:hypothetical protein
VNNGKLLKHTSAPVRLALVLEQYESRELGRIAKQARVSTRQMGNAWAARPVETGAYLRICAAINYDPCPDLRQPTTIEADGNFDPVLFAIGVRLVRALKHHSLREAATEMDVGAATVDRLEQADTMSVGTVLKACNYIGTHAYSYLHKIEKKEREASLSAPNSAVSCETKVISTT